MPNGQKGYRLSQLLHELGLQARWENRMREMKRAEVDREEGKNIAMRCGIELAEESGLDASYAV